MAKSSKKPRNDQSADATKPSDAPESKESSNPAPARRHDDESYKETFESVVIAFILAFVFRAYIVEAFVIPTGSMAPTLLGEHYNINCVKCGYNHSIDKQHGNLDQSVMIPCPMCHFPNKVKAHETDGQGDYLLNERGDPLGEFETLARVKSGDRILVQKYVNSMLRRFDVVVFKAPHRPFTNYIKRLIALEGEAIQIIEGNIYVNSTPGDESGWRIARKTDVNENPHALKIQRAVWQPIYHSQYVPLDWQTPDLAVAGKRHGRSDKQVFHVPWMVDDTSAQSAWKTWKTADGRTELDASVGYVHSSAETGRIRFNFDRFWSGGPGYFPYSLPYHATGGGSEQRRKIPVEDIRLAATFLPEKDGLRVTLRTTCRMDDQKGVMRVLFATVDSDGNVTLARKADLTTNQAVELGAAKVAPFAVGDDRRIELWYVDQEASVWIDGERVLTRRFDLPIDTIRNRALPCELLPDGTLFVRGRGRSGLLTPDVAIEVSGAPVSLHRVELDRDLHYMSAQWGTDFRASLFKRRDPNTRRLEMDGEPKVLTEGQFFCMGDNSPDSLDSRGWTSIDHWVYTRTIAEDVKEYDSLGVVPERLMMGRAFFVYFPAPHGLNGKTIQVIPNFGDMRFIH